MTKIRQYGYKNMQKWSDGCTLDHALKQPISYCRRFYFAMSNAKTSFNGSGTSTCSTAKL